MNVISPKAKIGKNVKIGNFVTIYDDVEVGDDSVIESYCEIGYSNGREKGPLKIGGNAHIRSHSIVYQGSVIGNGLVTGHHAIIRENMRIGDGFQLGAAAIVMGEAVIGNYVRTGSMVEIGQFSTIGDVVWIFIHSLLITDLYPPSDNIIGPHICDYAIIGANTVVYPGIKVGKNAIVAASCVLMEHLPDNKIAVGNPHRIVGSVLDIKIEDSGQPAYPWRYRFQRGYPEEIVTGWMNEVRDSE